MTILFGISIILFIIVCLLLVLLVLIQNDKGGGISGAIGGGLAGANSVIGAQDTANILSRMTTGFAIGYMVLCITLSLFLTRFATNSDVNNSSVLKKRAETESFAPASVLQGGGSLPIAEENAPEAEAASPVLPVEPVEKEVTP